MKVIDYKIQSAQMKTLKNYLNLFRLKGFIEDALAIKQLHFVKDQYFKDIINAVYSMQRSKVSDMKKILSEFFDKNRFNQKQTLRLLMIVHEILRQNDCFEVSEMIVQVLYEFCEIVRKIQDEKMKGVDSYLKRSFTVPYNTYLIKAYKKDSKEEFMENKQKEKREISSPRQVKGKTTNTTKFKQLQGIEMDFKIFNLVTDVLKFNSDLHQMGRFYSEHQYIINFYLQMLRDFQIYFKIIQYSFFKLTQLRQNQLSYAQTQRVYLFMSESERCVNKMNSFYYNKYLFYYVNDNINLKMHLQIPKDFYPVLNRSHRRIQKNLSFDYCLTATHPGHKMHQPDTKDTNRSKNNNYFKKIIQSIASLTQTLQQIQQIEKVQLDKEINKRQQEKAKHQQNMRKSAIF